MSECKLAVKIFFILVVITYGSGLSSFTDLSTSQSALSNARKQLIFAKNDLSMSRVNLAYCAGKILEQ